MAYLGNVPARSFISFERQVFTIVNSQTAYTLSHSVTNENDIRLVVNNVVQEPGSGKAYTATGTTLTLSAALTNGTDEMYCVFLGRAVGTVNAPAGSVGNSQTAATIVTGQTAETTVADDDTVLIHDTSASALRKMTVSNLTANAGPTLTGSTNNTLVTVTGANAIAGEATLTYDGTSLSNIPSGTESNLRLQNSTTGSGGTDGFLLQATGNNAYINNYESGFTSFRTSNTDRMRILSGGGVVIAKTSETIDDAGHEFRTNGFCAHTRTSDTVLLINRMGSDGTLQEFEAAGNLEGTISVSGSTVSYNGFTGTHWSRFQNNSTPTILRGTVLETLDEMCDWYNLEFDVINQDEDGNDITSPQKIPHVLLDSQSDGDVITYNHKGTDYQATIVKEVDVKHMMSKVSDTTDAKNVYGLFVAYDLDGEGYNDFYVASVGSYVVRIKQGETIAKGDLLQSNGDGTAKVQSDDNIKASSFAKVLSTTKIETYEDGSFIVPCSLMC